MLQSLCGIPVSDSSFFFFKQKTVYEMRISDWSSDVCSSDLRQDDRMRSCPLDALVPLLRIPDVAFFSLQKDAPMRLDGTDTLIDLEIGRASCRERVCQYV